MASEINYKNVSEFGDFVCALYYLPMCITLSNKNVHQLRIRIINITE